MSRNYQHTHEHTCEYCGRQFIARREHARFCSPVCRVTWHRKNDEPQTHRQAATRGHH